MGVNSYYVKAFSFDIGVNSYFMYVKAFSFEKKKYNLDKLQLPYLSIS